MDYQSRTGMKENLLSARSSEDVGSSGVSGQVVSVTFQKYDQFVVEFRFYCLVPKTSELDTYLGASVLPRTEIFYSLSWWKTNGVKYRNLQKRQKTF
ncbi:zinc finger BED domain-containing protein DAYSLEEPER-like [Dorcoceras hygrometricum]|uniref:Zinc finger BED domain-containing protein DAYSLEEPER-like n=1 Tax=Dorcoceras hygrometricum TaxID=472368 RepID=A0A2Z7CCP3_9LAMI|nr:zinc finger BED domain-containing protein DAYSLEEPER-like [Dorcoceras hygrometricum]